jgi:hypothetical protein
VTELNELEWELGGLMLDVRGDEGLDDVAEVEEDGEATSGDGASAGDMRLTPRAVTILTGLSPGGMIVDSTVEAAFAAALNQIRTVMAPLPDRTATRTLRWRRAGEVTKRLYVRPAVGRPLTVAGDEGRIKYQIDTSINLRLTADDPVIVSDALHTHTFTAGETATIVNAGSMTAVLPCAWSLTATTGVTLENLDFDEYVRFPAGPLTVSTHREAIAPGTYGLSYGPGSRILPRWPLLRPGNNTIKASAACTLSWRDTW